MLQLLFEKILFIHFYPLESALGWSLIHILDKFTKGTIHSMSNKVICLQYCIVILSSLSNSKIIMTTLVRKHDDAVLDIMQLYYSGQARASIPCFHHTSQLVRFLLPWLVLNKNPRSFCLMEDDQCCFYLTRLRDNLVSHPWWRGQSSGLAFQGSVV